MKRFTFCFAIFIAFSFLSAESKSVEKKERYATETISFSGYTANIRYNKTVCPGDAVFVKLELQPKDAKLKKKLRCSSGKIEFYDDASDKKLSAAKMYFFDALEKNKNKKSDVLFSGVPLSSYLEPKKHSIKIIFSAFEKEEIGLVFPVIIEKKDFIEETIPLDSKNTAIRTDDSAERMKQIQKLNKILDTADYDAIFQKGAFSPPTKATRRTSFFADRRTFVYTDKSKAKNLHYGIDYGVPTGSDVTACASGSVVLAEWRNSTGYSIVIEHLPNLYSLYYHLDELSVFEGSFVHTGDLIGKSGATGLATGPHLHWEIRLKMEAVNPDFFVENFDWK